MNTKISLMFISMLSLMCLSMEKEYPICEQVSHFVEVNKKEQGQNIVTYTFPATFYGNVKLEDSAQKEVLTQCSLNIGACGIHLALPIFKKITAALIFQHKEKPSHYLAKFFESKSDCQLEEDMCMVLHNSLPRLFPSDNELFFSHVMIEKTAEVKYNLKTKVSTLKRIEIKYKNKKTKEEGILQIAPHQLKVAFQLIQVN